MEKTKRAAIYARVSTVGAGQDPGMQIVELKEYCSRRGWEISGEYIDVGISGAKDSRPCASIFWMSMVSRMMRKMTYRNCTG
jgi:predicted site-specific integrase-resolvase